MGMQTICPTIHVQSLTNYANKQADKQTEISAPDSGSSQLIEILYGHACMCLFEKVYPNITRAKMECLIYLATTCSQCLLEVEIPCFVSSSKQEQ